MSKTSAGFANILLGINTSRRATVLLHVAFWAALYCLYFYQSRWFTGDEHPRSTVLIALSKWGVIAGAFYATMYVLHRAYSPLLKLLLVATAWCLTIVSYDLVSYYLYNYINDTVPKLPTYFHNIVKGISVKGPWTFLYDRNAFYLHFLQLNIGLFIPVIIKLGRWAARSRIKAIALEKDNLKLELEFLRAQINPHFLFNTLNSVYSLIEDKDKTAAFIIVSLSDMMRYALYDAATTEVDVAKELAFIQNYIEIQQIRHRRRLEVELEIAPDLGPQRIPPLLLINFVENAVKHGVDKLRHDAWVRIRAYRDELGTFCFAVANARPVQAGADVREGIGTRNTRRRLDLLYPGAYSLQTSHTATQFDILLRLWPPHNG
ncbi:sensor histidine kinase [Hymenobacter nivis]|nr:histidine kinase [Hymenobacter nivis]